MIEIEHCCYRRARGMQEADMEVLLLTIPPSYLSSGYPFWGPSIPGARSGVSAPKLSHPLSLIFNGHRQPREHGETFSYSSTLVENGTGTNCSCQFTADGRYRMNLNRNQWSMQRGFWFGRINAVMFFLPIMADLGVPSPSLSYFLACLLLP
ncbi:uncharacterized protein EV420DRAFT_1147617 [Desarmillaria tabescens]|uniref:Uncharacterized protein n=1 Tax=Armillaria tabescens TaxID=1929756 RepID=A0AA39NCA6_ARMTA|nr:uncharacterized protein EV420DRAFT_1147617 [Desarmillaria tabescens]KAK0462980.1 hypothetical protein EV420DRAFT_1147617 [Desarmillaria tabescens]